MKRFAVVMVALMAALGACGGPRAVSKGQLATASNDQLWMSIHNTIREGVDAKAAGFSSEAELLQATRDELVRRNPGQYGGPEHLAAINQGRVMDGMYYYAVCAAWGTPTRYEEERSSLGTLARAWWYYGPEWLASRRVTFFINQVLWWTVDGAEDAKQTVAGLR